MKSSNGTESLNRTSVGLKRRRNQKKMEMWHPPQSNQRGIETPYRALVRQAMEEASIEPAWD